MDAIWTHISIFIEIIKFLWITITTMYRHFVGPCLIWLCSVSSVPVLNFSSQRLHLNFFLSKGLNFITFIMIHVAYKSEAKISRLHWFYFYYWVLFLRWKKEQVNLWWVKHIKIACNVHAPWNIRLANGYAVNHYCHFGCLQNLWFHHFDMSMKY